MEAEEIVAGEPLPRADAASLLALDLILQSRTFRRCDQLKRFLRYVCELELSGRREEIDEYSVAVNALGRSADFSPDADSSVRTRAHSLRQKIEEYYRDEAPDASVRIELPKGSYVPVFRPVLPEPASVLNPPLASSADVDQTPSPQPGMFKTAPKDWKGRALWATLGAFAVILASILAVQQRWLVVGPRFETAAVLRELWGPLLDPGSPVVICVGQPPQVWVRSYGKQPPPDEQYSPFPDQPPTSGVFQKYYESITGELPGPGIVLHPSPNAPLWGDVAGAALAGRFLTMNGAGFEFLPERTIRGSYAIRGRNALLFGRPEYSPLVATALSRGYTVKYVPDIRRHAIVLQSDPTRRFLNSEETDLTNYGLITVLSEAGGTRRTIAFSGITSDGSQAGVEFVTSPDKVAHLKQQLAKSGASGWPDAFQIVVRTHSSRGYPLKVDYETHLVLR